MRREGFPDPGVASVRLSTELEVRLLRLNSAWSALRTPINSFSDARRCRSVTLACSCQINRRSRSELAG
eukprot:1740832-Rhodomonas_salina.1